MQTTWMILNIMFFGLVMTICLPTCRSIEISTDNTDGSSGNAKQQEPSVFGDSPSNFDEISKFMERSGNIFFGQQPAQANTGSSQNANQAQMLPYFPNGGSQIYPDYTSQSNANGAAAQPVAAQIPTYVNVPQRAPLLPQGNVATGNTQDNNAHQQALDGVQRTGNYGGYAQDDGHAGRTEYGYIPGGYHKDVKVVPQVGVGINLDPFRFIRALLRAIPRPLLNLNGKVFFGVELGNKLGLVPKKEIKEIIVAKPYPPHGGHYRK